MQKHQRSMQNDQIAMEGPAGGILAGVDVSRLAARAGEGHAVTDRARDLLRGAFHIHDCENDLLVHTTDARAERDAEVSITLPPGIVFGLLLAGDLAFSMNGVPHTLSAPQPMAFLMNVKAPAVLQRFLSEGECTQKVTVTVTRHWFEMHVLSSSPEWQRFFDEPDSFCMWQASTLLNSCGELLHLQTGKAQGEGRPPLEQLCLQAAASQCFTQALLESQPLAAPEALGLGAHHSSKKQAALVMRVDQALKAEGDLSGKVGVPQIAAQLGMSVSALQRTFKDIYGDSVANYIRRARLERARRALDGGMSIGEAAFQAGYRHPSNFASAFKKAFGYSPGSEPALR